MLDRIKNTLNRACTSILLLIPQLILLGFIFVPLNYLDFPWWADALIALFTVIFEKLGSLVYIIVWIWSFIIFIQTPFDYYSVIYLVFLLLYIVLMVLFRKAGRGR